MLCALRPTFIASTLGIGADKKISNTKKGRRALTRSNSQAYVLGVTLESQTKKYTKNVFD
jgi:hypothetical protein